MNEDYMAAAGLLALGVVLIFIIGIIGMVVDVLL